MPDLINSDSGGNTFYNYLTPLVRGESSLPTNLITQYLTSAFGVNNHATDGQRTYIRFPSSLETKTGIVTSSATTWRISVYNGTAFGIGFGQWPVLASGVAGNSSVCNEFGGGPIVSSATYFIFRVSNNHSFIQAAFSNSSLTTLVGFTYVGWLREPTYTGSTTYPRGLVGITQSAANRVTTENGTTVTALSTANNSITNPTITCSISTPGADATDIVIRDNASPNYAIGKLWNCVSLPASAVVGQIYKNLGVEPEGSSMNSWLCIAPWGGRKLAMRVWAEGFV